MFEVGCAAEVRWHKVRCACVLTSEFDMTTAPGEKGERITMIKLERGLATESAKRLAREQGSK